MPIPYALARGCRYVVSSMTPPTTLTRRSLLRTGALVTAATLVGLRPWAAARAQAAASHLRRSSYGGLVGKRFAAGSVDLRLISVADVAGAAADASLAGSEDAFVLTFSGPLDPVLETGTHTLSNAKFGEFDLFLSPVGLPRRDQRYEAVIDRSVAAPIREGDRGLRASTLQTRRNRRPLRRLRRHAP